MEITYGDAHEVTITGGGQPIKNGSVTISVDGVRAFMGTTDNNGKLRLDLLAVQHVKENEKVSQIDYNQYTFTVAGYTPRTVALSQLKYTTVIEL
jgi:hypothetical protein